MAYVPAIVIVAFNRPTNLKKLLEYLKKGNFPENQSIPLVISIDFEDSENNQTVYGIAKKFQWEKGVKTVVRHPQNLGLRNHILKCGDFTQEYGSIVLLEDDILLSPSFYEFGQSALNYYENVEEIAGVSLYAYEYEELGLYRFYPWQETGQTYFMQWASSRGQLWTWKQWQSFTKWYSENNSNIEIFNIPNRVLDWTFSWKKYFIAYLVDKNKFFAYPYVSYTTYSDEIGTNIKSDAKVNNVKISMGVNNENMKFSDFNLDNLKYDCFFQPVKKTIYVPQIEREIAVDFDLFGTKLSKNINAKYVLTIKKSSAPIQKFSNKIIPYELNLLLDEPGDILILSKKSDLIEKLSFLRKGYIWSNFRRKNSVTEMITIIMHKIIIRILG